MPVPTMGDGQGRWIWFSKELCGGGDLSELLRELDDEPLGTASIAQARRLGDGRISDSLYVELHIVEMRWCQQLEKA